MTSKSLFSFLSTSLFLSTVCVVILQNAVHSVICLVLGFLLACFILILLECEFFAFIFLIIYVGAIAVLFLFVVMMTDVKHLSNNKKNSLKFFFFGAFAASNFLYIILSTIDNFFDSSPYEKSFLVNTYNDMYYEDICIEIVSLGQVIYTHFVVQFLVAGLILFLSIIGVVALVNKPNEKKLMRDIRQGSRETGLE